MDYSHRGVSGDAANNAILGIACYISFVIHSVASELCLAAYSSHRCLANDAAVVAARPEHGVVEISVFSRYTGAANYAANSCVPRYNAIVGAGVNKCHSRAARYSAGAYSRVVCVGRRIGECSRYSALV